MLRNPGPTLPSFSVAGALADPSLQLFQTNADESATLLQTNSGRGGDRNLAAAVAQVRTFAWPKASSLDAALLVTLQPGGHTAEVTGESVDAGVAWVEGYEVP